MKGSRKDGTNARALGLNPRAQGTNKNALGTNPRANRRLWSKAERMGWEATAEPAANGLPRWLRFEVLKRDGFACRYCGARPADGARLQVDHVRPKVDGGSDDPSNLTTACEDCNTGKAARRLDESIL